MSRDYCTNPYLLLKTFYLHGLLTNRLQKFRKYFHFREDIWLQSSKFVYPRTPCRQRLRRDTSFSRRPSQNEKNEKTKKRKTKSFLPAHMGPRYKCLTKKGSTILGQCYFKGTVSRDFWTFFWLKSFDLVQAPYKQATTVSRTFSFLRRYSIAKIENPVSS